jgi:hypothetical protein
MNPNAYANNADLLQEVERAAARHTVTALDAGVLSEDRADGIVLAFVAFEAVLRLWGGTKAAAAVVPDPGNANMVALSAYYRVLDGQLDSLFEATKVVLHRLFDDHPDVMTYTARQTARVIAIAEGAAAEVNAGNAAHVAFTNILKQLHADG